MLARAEFVRGRYWQAANKDRIGIAYPGRGRRGKDGPASGGRDRERERERENVAYRGFKSRVLTLAEMLPADIRSACP